MSSSSFLATTCNSSHDTSGRMVWRVVFYPWAYLPAGTVGIFIARWKAHALLLKDNTTPPCSPTTTHPTSEPLTTTTSPARVPFMSRHLFMRSKQYPVLCPGVSGAFPHV